MNLPALPKNTGTKILDFDIENRPLSYWYDGNCTAEITAIAWQFVGNPNGPVCNTLDIDVEPGDSARNMLRSFVFVYDMADMVTGHFIRKHDLPIINAALIELGMPQLGEKLTCDTKLDLVRFSDLAKSQEALGGMLGLEAPKIPMTQTDWRDANRLTVEGIQRTRQRVIGDVRQHMQLRLALLERGLLKPPKMWRP